MPQKAKCGAAEAAPHFIMRLPISLFRSEEQSIASGGLMNAISKPLPVLRPPRQNPKAPSAELQTPKDPQPRMLI